jgi:excisionase family DNA binding protein
MGQHRCSDPDPTTPMAQDLYSVEEVAALLGLHVRTVRGYVRDGRLRAVRIGKQYRIARADLEAFTGGPLAPPERVRRARHAEVSSVVQVDAIDPDAAGRVTNLLMAAAKGRDSADAPLRIDVIHDPERGRLKVIVTGGLAASAGLLRLVAALVEEEGT